MKKTRIVLCFAVTITAAFLFCFTAFADTEGIFTYSVSGDTASISAITPENGNEIVIPDTLGGYPVTEINGYVLQGSSVVVENLVIPASVTNITDNIKFGNASLERITVDENNTVYSTENGVLFDKEKTTIYKFPMYRDEFEYTVPGTVTQIYNGAFSNAVYLGRVNVCEGVVSFGDQAFAFTDLQVNFPSTLQTIAGNCFAYNNAIERAVLPPSVSSIGMSAFTDCESLKTVIITGNVTSIGSWTFDNTSLKTIVLPASLTRVSNEAFIRTTGIERVLFAGTQEQWDEVNVGTDNGSFETAQVICGFPLDSYKNITAEEENGLLTVSGSGALEGAGGTGYHLFDDFANGAKALYIEGNVTMIGENTFAGFSELETVICETNGISFEAGAFSDCESLRNLIVFGDSGFSPDAFVNCGEYVNMFADAQSLHNTGGAGGIEVIPVSYSGGTLTYEGAVYQNSYDFFDVLSVMCSRYGEINSLRANTLSIEGVTLYGYDAETGRRTRIDGPLENCEVYVQIDTGEGVEQISFNELTEGIADGSVTGFYIVFSDETHEEIEEASVSIVENIITVIRKVLRAIVTLLNKLFTLIKAFGK
ncbi:MAG: leucine-rich repeat protein [Clostridia bacterium]|nr:leucine-rich repeat protein [Clostridia bacterium]